MDTDRQWTTRVPPTPAILKDKDGEPLDHVQVSFNPVKKLKAGVKSKYWNKEVRYIPAIFPIIVPPRP